MTTSSRFSWICPPSLTRLACCLFPPLMQVCGCLLLQHTCPADILASNWLCGKPAAFDLSVTSPLNSSVLPEAAGQQQLLLSNKNTLANDAKWTELGWTCIPLVAESYGAWGNEAIQAFSWLASHLATRTNTPKSKVVSSLYGRLYMTLVRADARALLLWGGCQLPGRELNSVLRCFSFQQCIVLLLHYK